jgi:adenosylcobinamide kinase/adenosylcobinamide-phosphate guanylyltransferase
MSPVSPEAGVFVFQRLFRGVVMSKITFITGGARSGKSRFAEDLAKGFGAPLGYLATACPGDEEMKSRVLRHQARRGDIWQTMEEPLDLCGVIEGHEGHFRAILVDCVTLWLTNMLLAKNPTCDPIEEVQRLARLFPVLQTPLIFVSNEVGMGIVPDNALARQFRDLAGEANEILATAADEVYVMFSGLPLKLK